MPNRRRQDVIAVVSLAAILAGASCRLPREPQVTLTLLGAERTYPPTPDSVALPLYATVRPECPYEEIATITAEGTTSRSVETEVLAALRERARSVGAHAIIGYTQTNRQASRVGGSESSDIHVRGGTAIRFRSADCMK